MTQLPQSQNMTANEVDGVVYYTFPLFSAVSGIRHGISTRLGGVSDGIYESMNLSFTRGDNDAAVRENFERFCAALGTDSRRAAISAQEHHTIIRNVTTADCGKGIYLPRDYTNVDGLITDEVGITLFTQYADCVPLLFVDPVKRVVATSHAGWKGTVAEIGAVTVEQMCTDYGCRREDILAAIGPSIGQCCFEVDEPVYEAFSHLTVFDTDCYRGRGEKYDIDLWEVNRRILRSAGITDDHIAVTDLCTKCHPDVFWSHRVCGKERGSLAAAIALV